MLTGCWYSVLSLYKTLKNLENVENYIRTCGGGVGILLFLLSSKIRLNMGSSATARAGQIGMDFWAGPAWVVELFSRVYAHVQYMS